jgi:hypothetical protein
MAEVKCNMCDRVLSPGANRYVLEMRLFADYDGIIDIRDEEGVDALIDDLSEIPARNLEDQIYTERRHLLCPQCRQELLEMLPEETPEYEEEPEDDENGTEGNEPLH